MDSQHKDKKLEETLESHGISKDQLSQEDIKQIKEDL